MSKSTLGSFYDYFVPGATEATSEWLPDVLWPDADRRHDGVSGRLGVR